MKKLLLLFILASSLATQAQTDSIQAPYLRFPTIPPFQLLQLDSTTMLTKEHLKKKRPVLLMFFSPDCDHCQHQMEDMLKSMDDFKNIQIVLATARSFTLMKDFYEKYQLAKYPNVYIGQDIKYIIPPFFRMRNLPHLSLYDRKGNLITTFDGNAKPDVLLKAFSTGSAVR